ncbi:hypothetical protein C7M84_025505 [Penaeus vannamei]|uniref:Uncharacterized protein n=1 Tax=Penaeus vannamei TaxID=6689 RepID=A0A3R7PBX3_PENVA|nr:hypothetical protein C7M84_025505 [Penaeus vannamei]
MRFVFIPFSLLWLSGSWLPCPPIFLASLGGGLGSSQSYFIYLFYLLIHLFSTSLPPPLILLILPFVYFPFLSFKILFPNSLIPSCPLYHHSLPLLSTLLLLLPLSLFFFLTNPPTPSFHLFPSLLSSPFFPLSPSTSSPSSFLHPSYLFLPPPFPLSSPLLTPLLTFSSKSPLFFVSFISSNSLPFLVTSLFLHPSTFPLSPLSNPVPLRSFLLLFLSSFPPNHLHPLILSAFWLSLVSPFLTSTSLISSSPSCLSTFPFLSFSHSLLFLPFPPLLSPPVPSPDSLFFPSPPLPFPCLHFPSLSLHSLPSISLHSLPYLSPISSPFPPFLSLTPLPFPLLPFPSTLSSLLSFPSLPPLPSLFIHYPPFPLPPISSHTLISTPFPFTPSSHFPLTPISSHSLSLHSLLSLSPYSHFPSLPPTHFPSFPPFPLTLLSHILFLPFPSHSSLLPFPSLPPPHLPFPSFLRG